MMASPLPRGGEATEMANIGEIDLTLENVGDADAIVMSTRLPTASQLL